MIKQRQVYYFSKLKHCLDRILVFQNGKIKDRCVQFEDLYLSSSK